MDTYRKHVKKVMENIQMIFLNTEIVQIWLENRHNF
jgi:hypothetical protein